MKLMDFLIMNKSGMFIVYVLEILNYSAEVDSQFLWAHLFWFISLSKPVPNTIYFLVKLRSVLTYLPCIESLPSRYTGQINKHFWDIMDLNIAKQLGLRHHKHAHLRVLT